MHWLTTPVHLLQGIGFLSAFIIADNPETAWFLNAEEKALACRRVASEHLSQQNSTKTSGKAVKQGFANMQVCCSKLY